MLQIRLLAIIALGLLASGCGGPSLPAFSETPATSAASHYPVRTDLMVVGKTGLDGTPQKWPSAGFPPMKSAGMHDATPDRDLADEIRKQIGRTVLDPTNRARLTLEQTDMIGRLLGERFGTPAEPRVHLPDWNEVTIDAVARPEPSDGVIKNLKAIAKKLKEWKSKPIRTEWERAKVVKERLKLDDATLARGSIVYRRWCMQCHGVSGAGDGSQAIELAAMPRDYRQGIFKFITAYPLPGQAKKGAGPAGKPRREDLKRTIRLGIDGSMMPAFTSLTEEQLDDVVSYVIHLAVRGETEFATMNKAMNPTEEDPDFNGNELRWLFDRNQMGVLYNWGMAQESPIPIPPENTPTTEARMASAARGAQRYLEFGCAACHANYGREPQLKWDLWGGVTQPRNLVLGVYRGGRRGEDLYARIYGGIYPSGMPNHVEKLAGSPSDPDQPDKIWDLVHFLQALADPYDRVRVRDIVRKTDATFNIEP
ncbi:MAG TPA: cytochrome c [Gemmata sp.]|nr:cytochrome c [Gemmata sp.]